MVCHSAYAVEVCQRYDSLRDEEDVRREVAQLVAQKGVYPTEQGLDVSNTDLLDDVERVYVAESGTSTRLMERQGRKMRYIRHACADPHLSAMPNRQHR